MRCDCGDTPTYVNPDDGKLVCRHLYRPEPTFPRPMSWYEAAEERGEVEVVPPRTWSKPTVSENFYIGLLNGFLITAVALALVAVVLWALT